MSDNPTFKWVHGSAKADCDFGEQSANLNYRSDTGPVSSVNLCNVGTNAEIGLMKVEKGYGDGAGTLSAQGPSASGDVRLQWNNERVGVNAMAEASAFKAKASAGPGFVEANLNANTGVKAGTDGVKFGVLGWGLTLGVGGRWSFDSPVGSVGASTATNARTVTEENRHTNVRYS